MLSVYIVYTDNILLHRIASNQSTSEYNAIYNRWMILRQNCILFCPTEFVFCWTECNSVDRIYFCQTELYSVNRIRDVKNGASYFAWCIPWLFYRKLPLKILNHFPTEEPFIIYLNVFATHLLDFKRPPIIEKIAKYHRILPTGTHLLKGNMCHL